MLSAASRPVGDSFFEHIRAREFAHLDSQGLVYLDYTGSAIPSASQIRAHDEFMRTSLLGNPHSENAPSRRSGELIEQARRHVLEFFHADPAEYSVCFTANASASIKLVAESFPFRRGSALVLSADNHNSVNGVAEFARRREATVSTIPLTADLRLRAPAAHLSAFSSGAPSLFAFPAQSNFSGARHSLRLIDEARRAGYRVLLDAAAYVPTSPLDLRTVAPDFVAISFYKMFGFPSGVGALIMRSDAMRELERPWFAGGTVDWASVQHRSHRLRASVEAFEDGTPNFYGIAAVDAGLRFVREVDLTRVSAHVSHLARHTHELIAAAAHRNGAPMFRSYGPRPPAEQGGTIALNLLDARGAVLPYEMVERRARELGVAVRGGCFCNPGASERAFGFHQRATARCFRRTRGRAFSPRALGECLGQSFAVGAVRLSFGIATTVADVSRGVSALVSIADAGAARRAS